MAKSKYIVKSEIDVRETHAKTLARLAMNLASEMIKVGDDLKQFLGEWDMELPIDQLRALSVTLRYFEPQKVCKQCGKEFTSKGRGSVQHFCSVECRQENYKARRRKAAVIALAGEPIMAAGEGELLPFEPTKETPAMYDQPMITQIEVIPTVEIEAAGEAAGEPIRACEVCGKEFEVKPKNPNKRFCSANCRAKAHKAAKVASEAAGKVVNRVVGLSGEFYERVELIRGAVELGIE